MGGACGRNGAENRCIERPGFEVPRDRNHLDDLDRDEQIILKRVL
jgi:hypothetical protein